LLLEIFRIYEDASDFSFKLWAMSERKKCEAYIKSKRLGVRPTENFSYTSICTAATTEFNNAVDSNRWSLSGIEKEQTKNDLNQELPSSYVAAFTTAINKLESAVNKIGNSRNSTGRNGCSSNIPKRKCFRCGSETHLIQNCPNRNSEISSSTNNMPSSTDSTSDMPWYLIPPTNGEGCKKHRGVWHYWCTDCNLHSW